ncbi:MAG: class I SAM-dependent DNA methyltransferase [Caldilineaceae bacterium]
MNLSSTIKSIQDIMRKDDGVDGDAQRIGQLTWMLFLKVFDEREEEWEANGKKRGDTYVSPLAVSYRWRNWAIFVPDEEGKPQPKIPAEKLIAFVNGELFPFLQSIEVNNDPVRKVIRQVFEDSNNYMKSGTLMLGVIEKLNEAIDFNDFKTRQNLGDIYEQILNDLRSAGNAGEFYTPRAITQVMVELLDPHLDQGETIMDPACGTGGFLTASIDYFRKQCGKELSAEEQQAIENSFKGIEKKQLPHLLCTTNLLLHGIDVPSQIEHMNTLARSWNAWTDADQVDCVVTNPPFGGLEDDTAGDDYPEALRTRETSDMFITLIVGKLLKQNGRCAVVLPDGFLFGEGVKGRIKERLMEECNLHTIIRLPNGVFAPYTSIKTNILFFTKGKPTETIWFYEHPYPEGRKSYSKTRPIRIEEFDAEKAWWGDEANGFAERQESELAWSIDFKGIKERAKAQAQPHWDKADDLNAQVTKLEAEIRDLRASISRVIDVAQREPVEAQIDKLRIDADRLRRQASEAQTIGDRLYWPIYNIDIKNPNSPEEKIDDPDELLERYNQLLDDIRACYALYEIS